jgi:hypothetical protein
MAALEAPADAAGAIVPAGVAAGLEPPPEHADTRKVAEAMSAPAVPRVRCDMLCASSVMFNVRISHGCIVLNVCRIDPGDEHRVLDGLTIR